MFKENISLGTMTTAPLLLPAVASTPDLEEELARAIALGDPSHHSPVGHAMREAVFSGGQRLRPQLAVAIGRTVSADARLVMRGAVAVELIHCASLIVDDLPCMDNEAVRRGRPSIHRRFGESTAILSAFALVAVAARSIIGGITASDTLRRMTGFQARLLAGLDCNNLVGGQALDLAGGGCLQELAARKTAPLFALAAEAGCLGASVSPVTRRAAIQFGHEFGVAYQLRDDRQDGELRDPALLAAQLQRTRDALIPLGHPAAELTGLLGLLHG